MSIFRIHVQDQKSLFSGGLKVWSEDKTFCSTEFKLHLRVKKNKTITKPPGVFTAVKHSGLRTNQPREKDFGV